MSPQKQTKWYERTASIGQLAVAVAVAIAGAIVSVAAFVNSLEHRITALEEGRIANFQSIIRIRDELAEGERQMARDIKEINDKLTQLLVINAQQHPPLLSLTPRGN